MTFVKKASGNAARYVRSTYRKCDLWRIKRRPTSNCHFISESVLSLGLRERASLSASSAFKATRRAGGSMSCALWFPATKPCRQGVHIHVLEGGALLPRPPYSPDTWGIGRSVPTDQHGSRTRRENSGTKRSSCFIRRKTLHLARAYSLRQTVRPSATWALQKAPLKMLQSQYFSTYIET